MGNVFHKSGSGSPVTPITGPVPTATATAIVAPFSISSHETHEANVEFSRNLVVQLVENLPTKNVRVEPPVTRVICEARSPAKSLESSEISFASACSANVLLLPSQLQCEDADRKQTDTDTDTTEYESAGDSTVPPSPLGSLAGDCYSQEKSAPSVGNVSKCSPCTQERHTTENTNVSTSVETVASESQHALNRTELCCSSPQGSVSDSPVVPPVSYSLNITGLCDALEDFHLQSPSSAIVNVSSDSICSSSESALSDEKLPDLRTPNFAQYCDAVDSKVTVPCLPVFEAQDSATPETEKCNAPLTLPVSETEFHTEVPIKTSTPIGETEFLTGVSNKISTHRDDSFSTIEKETDVKDSINTTYETVPVSNEGKVLEHPPEYVPVTEASLERESEEKETLDHSSVSYVSHSAAESLQDTFQVLPEVSSRDTAKITVGLLSQACEGSFEKLSEDLADHKPETTLEALNKTFELLPGLPFDESQGASQSLNKTFELLTDESAVKSEVASQENGTFELKREEPGIYSVSFIGNKAVNSSGDVANTEENISAVNVIDLKAQCQLQREHHTKGEVDNSVSCEHVDNETSCVNGYNEQSSLVECRPDDISKLVELCKICDEPQDAFKSADEFVNADNLFSNQQEVVKSDASLCPVGIEIDFPEVKQSTTDLSKVVFEQISVEAKRLSQQFAIIASSELAGGDSVEVLDCLEMEGTNRPVSGVSPASRQSPHSVHSSRGSSPAKRLVAGEGTPKTKPKLVSDTSKELDCREIEDPFKPRSRIQNSPPRNQCIGDVPLLHQDVSKEESVESSVHNSSSNCNNHSEAGPEIADLSSSEVFKDPSAFEFLSSVGSQQHSERNTRLESLYVKFDPLVGTVSSTNSSLVLPQGVSNGTHTEEDSEYDSRNPVEREGVLTPRKEDLSQHTPRKVAVGDKGSNGVQVTPSPASLLIDKLISLSPSPEKTCVAPSPPRQQGPSPRKGVDVSLVQQSPVARKVHPSPISVAAVKSGLSEMEQVAMLEELLRLKDLLAEQDNANAVEVAKKDQEIASLQGRLSELEDKFAKGNRQVAEKTRTVKDMSVILDEYEKTISRLIADKEQEQRAHELQVSAIAKERDVHKGHLDTIEIAFSDLHKKYERSKEIIEGLRKNEEVLRASLAEYESSIRSKVQQYEALKTHAVGQLEDANQQLDVVRRSHAAETAKLQAMLKKAELKVNSLEEMLDQKIKENQELTHICDELISKVGAGN